MTCLYPFIDVALARIGTWSLKELFRGKMMKNSFHHLNLSNPNPLLTGRAPTVIVSGKVLQLREIMLKFVLSYYVEFYVKHKYDTVAYKCVLDV
jgi:hypothetical protein